MIKVNRKDQTFYIYRHVRLDTNEVFYIGKGKTNLAGKRNKTVFRRAFQKSKIDRSHMWHSITNKTGYTVEIVFISNDENKIKLKEQEFIKLYGRRDLGLGSLVNFSDGGDGRPNHHPTEETRRKMRENNTSKNRTGSLHSRSRPVFVYKTDGNFYKKFDSQTQASQELRITPRNLLLVLRGDYQQIRGYIFKNEYKGLVIKFNKKLPSNRKQVICFDSNMNFIREFSSTTDAGLFFNRSPKRIHAICSRNQSCGGFYLRFKI